MKIDPLDYPGLKIRKKAEILFTLRITPSFSPESTWTLIHDENKHYIRRFMVVMPTEKYQIEPNLFGSEAIIEDKEAEKILERMQKIELNPFLIGKSVGLDGNMYEIQMNRFVGSTIIQWWSHGQKEWMQMENWFQETILLFQKILPKPPGLTEGVEGTNI
jgi:hypothetical protein